MKHCNNHLKLLNNIKEIRQKEREAWGRGAQLDKIETDCIWIILKKVARHFSSSWQMYIWIKVVFAQNHLVCDVTISLSVKEFDITIFEF